MKQTVSEYDFTEAFRLAGRKDQFSYEGLQLLFNYLEEMEEGMDEEIELDVIALCCEYYESSWEEIADNYSIDTSDCADEDEAKQAVEEYLMENTSLVGAVGDGFIYAAF